MNESGLQFATVFAGFLAIMNPLASTPIFLGLTEGDDKKTRRAIAFRSLGLTFAIIAGFSVMGKLIFHLFGITMPALRIAGGVLVFKIGFDMLQGDSSKPHTLDDKHVQDRVAARLSVAVCPRRQGASPGLRGGGGETLSRPAGSIQTSTQRSRVTRTRASAASGRPVDRKD